MVTKSKSKIDELVPDLRECIPGISTMRLRKAEQGAREVTQKRHIRLTNGFPEV
jgi:hypothetical protein